MTRILYIYAKLNPKIQYVQGMNEILAPIFYLVNVTKPANMIEESSCFYMFNSAISDIIELHIKDLDKSEHGIYGKLNEVSQMLVVNSYLFRLLSLSFGVDYKSLRLTLSFIALGGLLCCTLKTSICSTF